MNVIRWNKMIIQIHRMKWRKWKINKIVFICHTWSLIRLNHQIFLCKSKKHEITMFILKIYFHRNFCQENSMQNRFFSSRQKIWFDFLIRLFIDTNVDLRFSMSTICYSFFLSIVNSKTRIERRQRIDFRHSMKKKNKNRSRTIWFDWWKSKIFSMFQKH